MSKSMRNTGKDWTASDVKQIRTLSRQNTPARVIALKLGRTEAAIRSRAQKEGFSLKAKASKKAAKKR